MFITLDGPDGTGKTTVAKALVDLLNEKGIPSIYTSEPTDTALGKDIRRILKAGGAEMASLTGLFIKDREQHIKTCIEPALREGKTVICDRYKYSTVCYQHLQGEEIKMLIDLNSTFLVPDLAVIFYAEDVDILLSRIGKRGMEKDLFETRSTLQRSIALYREMASLYPKEKIVYFNAEGDTQAVLSAIFEQITLLRQ